MRSLSARLLVAVSILLLIALSLTAIILDRIFRNAASEATTERINSQLILLLSSAEIDEVGKLVMPDIMPEARFMTPGSGLLGFVTDSAGLQWKSASAVGVLAPLGSDNLSETNTLNSLVYNDIDYFQSSMSVEWEVADDTYKTLIFTAAESSEPYYTQLKQFRTRLFSWFAFLIVCIVSAQAMLMRWVLKPLRKIAIEVSEIDQGERDLLSDNYPSELLGVTTNTNALIKAERSRMERYRNTLGNLAHSLKTPLAVIQSATEKEQADKSLIQQQVKSMNDIVGYQLKRAATAGQTTLGREPVEVEIIVTKIINALNKVYFDKNIQFEQNIEPGLLFYGDAGDLTEVLGNMLDNAAKWSSRQVQIIASSVDNNRKRNGIKLIIADDGHGVEESERARILQRGQRADEATPGYGIGLSVVKEILQSYQGQLEIGNSTLGGAQFTLVIPSQ